MSAYNGINDEQPQSSIPIDAQVFMISVAAELAGMHAQTLRTYDRLGLVSPKRTQGGGRRYSSRDVELLKQVQRLSQEEGVNLAGIKQIIELTNKVHVLERCVQELKQEVHRLHITQSVAPVSNGSAVVVWKPHIGKRHRNQ